MCGNRIQLPMDTTDEQRVNRAIGNILRPELVDIVIDGVRQVIHRHRRRVHGRRWVADIEAIEAQIGNLADAIAHVRRLAGADPTVRAAEERPSHASHRLGVSGTTCAPSAGRLARLTLAKRPRCAASDATTIHSCYAVRRQSERGFRFEGSAKVGELLAGVVGVDGLASPGGFGQTDTGLWVPFHHFLPVPAMRVSA